jgi:predicted phosphodiesterase|uniref:metallophosphoesterase family protein n=1 Tax=Cephaloticoccus sp. TaxID=1985742 RepID=UPI00404975C2
MRIAVISDIHGNLPALETALAAVEELKPDRLIVGGDVVDGAPDSAACWERVKQLQCPVLRGNHERYVFDFGTERADPIWATDQFAPLHYTHRSLSNAQRNELAALPMVWRSTEAPGLLVVHASARSDADSVLPHTSLVNLDAMFVGVTEELIIRSHNHISSTRDWRGRRIVTTGAVGLPLDGLAQVQFCLLTYENSKWQAEHHSVPYDVEATLGRFRDSGYLDETGPLGRMFMREVATGSHHVVPFLRYCRQRMQHGAPLDLIQAEKDFVR